MSRDVSFVQNMFPFVQGRESSVEIRDLTGGPDNDWIIDVVASDGGVSLPQMK